MHAPVATICPQFWQAVELASAHGPPGADEQFVEMHTLNSSKSPCAVAVASR